ncbi:MAG: hypothetical protein WAW86_07995 [Gammaproteobacteria bacterium]
MKFLLPFVSLFVCITAFSSPSHVKLNSFETNTLYRDYRPADAAYAIDWSKYVGPGPTVLIYLQPTLTKNSNLKSDPLYIDCNGQEIILSPNESYACSIKSYDMNGKFSYKVAEGYEKNGSEVTIVEINPKTLKMLS